VSWPAARRLARALGDAVRAFDRPARKRRMFRDIHDAFPDFAPHQVRAVIRDAYRSLMVSVVDTLHFHRVNARGGGRALIDFLGTEPLQDPSRRTGVIFVTAHIGCWEVLGEAGTCLGYPVMSVARPLDNPLLDDYVREIRESAGQEIIPKDGALRHALSGLRSGRNLAFLIDQDARRKGVFVDFMGKPASTHVSVARLAISTGAPVAFVYCRRIEGQDRFAAVITDVIRPRPDAGRDEEVLRITQQLTRDLEDVVRRWPGDWLWMHDRWKTYPGKYERMGGP